MNEDPQSEAKHNSKYSWPNLLVVEKEDLGWLTVEWTLKNHGYEERFIYSDTAHFENKISEGDGVLQVVSGAWVI